MILGVSQEMLDRCETQPLETVFLEHEESPQSARMLQGRIALDFPGAREQGMSIVLVPAVRAWGRRVYERIPHLLYYIAPESSGSTPLLVASFLETSVDPKGGTGSEADDLDFMHDVHVKYLVPAGEFADSIADDWRPIVNAHVETMVKPLKARILATVEESLASLEES